MGHLLLCLICFVLAVCRMEVYETKVQLECRWWIVFGPLWISILLAFLRAYRRLRDLYKKAKTKPNKQGQQEQEQEQHPGEESTPRQQVTNDDNNNMATPYHAVVANDESSMSLALKTTSDLEMEEQRQVLRFFENNHGCWHLFKFPVLWLLVLVMCVCKLEGATFSLLWILAPLMFWTGIDFLILVLVDEIIRFMEKQEEGESICCPLPSHHNQDPLLGSIVTVHSASPPPSPSRPQQQIDVVPQIDMDETTLRAAMHQLYDPGILIVAHKFGGNKPKSVRLRLTEHVILWRTETRNKSKDTNQPKLGPLHQVSLSHIQHVLTGKHTTTLRSVETASVSENLCVSLCFVEGTLHFEADSPRDRNVWLACFTLVLRHKIFVPAFMDIVYEAMVREDMFPGVRDDVKAEIFRMQAQDFRD